MSRILVIDDEKDVLLLLQEALTTYGHDVTGAVSGVEAVDFLENQKADLIILDLRMPDISGLELLRWVRDHQIAAPVIVCSALSALRNEYTVSTSHVSAFIPKPIDLPHLIAEVSRALGPDSTTAMGKA